LLLDSEKSQKIALEEPPASAQKPILPIERIVTSNKSGQQGEATENQPGPWPVSSFSAEELSLDTVAIFADIQASVKDWTPEVYFDRFRKRTVMSGRDAYAVYTYLRSCTKQPRSVEQYATLEAEFASLQGTSDLAAIMEHYQTGLSRCEGLGEQRELILAMIDWLTMAAERGFPQAQISYYRSFRWLLSNDPWLPYLAPEHVHAYRQRAKRFLLSAMESGHPEALSVFALAHVERIIVEENVVTAFAYALAAEQASQGSNYRAKLLLASIEPALSQQQIDEARHLAEQICEDYCQ